MSKWDELRKILDDAEKAEGERLSPPKSVVEEIWGEIHCGGSKDPNCNYLCVQHGDSPDTTPEMLCMALAEAVEWINWDRQTMGKESPVAYSGKLSSVLSILRGEETRSIPK